MCYTYSNGVKIVIFFFKSRTKHQILGTQLYYIILTEVNTEFLSKTLSMLEQETTEEEAWAAVLGALA